MADPKLGMYYEVARKKAKHFASLKAGNKALQQNIVKSIINQSRLCHGEGAAKEIEKELSGVRSFSGAGNKQIGIGEGKRLGEGKWTFTEKGWEKL